MHLSYESYVQLASPCISLAYEPLAPVLSMASLLVIFLVDCFLTRYLHRLRKKHQRNRKLASEAKQEQLQQNDNTTMMLTLGQSGPGTIPLPMRKTMESMERDEELDRLEEERLDEKSRMMEVMVIEGGIV